MISVMTAKWIGDAFDVGGIYSVWIAMRGYPWLSSVDFKDKGETGAQIMKPTQNLVVIEDGQFKTSELSMTSHFSELELKY
jgi:chloride channel 3/4/5